MLHKQPLNGCGSYEGCGTGSLFDFFSMSKASQSKIISERPRGSRWGVTWVGQWIGGTTGGIERGGGSRELCVNSLVAPEGYWKGLGIGVSMNGMGVYAIGMKITTGKDHFKLCQSGIRG